jgi:predicted site-specific integrase-resolvase
MSSETFDAYRIEDWAARNGISRSQAYKEIHAGRLIARKVGNRTIITDEDGMAWRRALPQMRAAQSETRSA